MLKWKLLCFYEAVGEWKVVWSLMLVKQSIQRRSVKAIRLGLTPGAGVVSGLDRNPEACQNTL